MSRLIIILTLFIIETNLIAIKAGHEVEVNLPAQDCHTGQFYIGRFTIGTYEILCNVIGYDANNCGWKILIGKNWGTTRAVQFTELHNSLGGRFFVENESPTVFHLWWLSEYKDIKKDWYPRLKVEYRAGSFSIENSKVFSSSAKELMSNVFMRSNNIGIGTTTPSAKLDVNGNIKAHEIAVTLASIDDMQLNGTLAANNITYTANGNTADFVFEDNYQLKDLSEVEAFILTNKHLPEIPSATDMEEAGVNLAEMNKLLLMKVEELTLYSIEQEKKIEELTENRRRVTEVESALNTARQTLKSEATKREALEERLNQLEKIIINLNN